MIGEEIKILDMSLPSYGAISDPKQADLDSLKKDLPKNVPAIISKKESSSAAKASSKRAKKAIIQKEEDDDEKTKNLKILDMSLPSYSESTVGKGKDAFLLWRVKPKMSRLITLGVCNGMLFISVVVGLFACECTRLNKNEALHTMAMHVWRAWGFFISRIIVKLQDLHVSSLEHALCMKGIVTIE